MRRVQEATLRAACQRVLVPFGMSAEHVAFVVDTLVSTSLDGIDTHGVRLLPTYVRELEGGRAKRTPRFEVTSRMPAVATLDADDALGVVAGNVAIELIVERAQKLGVAAIAVKRSNHFGAAGYYTARAAARGMLALAFSNSDALVSPFGGARSMSGTNPLSMAVPGFCLDMATSQISFSKVMNCLATGEPLSPGWAKDDTGQDASQARRVASLSPVGGYKGQGLGMMVQILSAGLTDMPWDADISRLYEAPYDKPREIGHFFLCVDLRAFGEPRQIEERVGVLLEAFRAQPGVLCPGDKERAARQERTSSGIPLSDAEWAFFEPYLVGA